MNLPDIDALGGLKEATEVMTQYGQRVFQCSIHRAVVGQREYVRVELMDGDPDTAVVISDDDRLILLRRARDAELNDPAVLP
jgi:hypothetical protein